MSANGTTQEDNTIYKVVMSTPDGRTIRSFPRDGSMWETGLPRLSRRGKKANVLHWLKVGMD
jgi:hypothetical protein